MEIIREIGERLGVLASRAAQWRYMVNADADEYLLIEEAIDNALEVDEPRLLLHMDGRVRESVARFVSVLRGAEDALRGLPQLPWNATLLDETPMCAVRASACQCLDEIGFDLGAWEKAEGYAD
jgi:hypothetical protein